jgi:hypothetical protein
MRIDKHGDWREPRITNNTVFQVRKDKKNYISERPFFAPKRKRSAFSLMKPPASF